MPIFRKKPMRYKGGGNGEKDAKKQGGKRPPKSASAATQKERKSSRAPRGEGGGLAEGERERVTEAPGGAGS